MADKRNLVIVVTNGFNDERSSVAWSVANSGINSGLKVTMFLVSSGVDWVRRGAAEVASGGNILVCPPCAKVRGYSERDLIQGVSITGSEEMHELISQGAATLSF